MPGGTPMSTSFTAMSTRGSRSTSSIASPGASSGASRAAARRCRLADAERKPERPRRRHGY